MKQIKKIHGPYNRKQDKRLIVIIVFTDNTKTTMSYPRYLMEQHIKRPLKVWEAVDHINGDCSDNRIENLQIVTWQQNSKKYAHVDACIFQKHFHFTCPVCNQQTSKQFNEVKHNWNLGKSGPFCSKNCSRDFQLYDYSAHMVKSENTTVLKTVGIILPYEFKSRYAHQFILQPQLPLL